jgi:hypothetical protein
LSRRRKSFLAPDQTTAYRDDDAPALGTTQNATSLTVEIRMHAQIITYKLKDVSASDYQKMMVEPDAPVLAKVPGLISKTWLADTKANSYGGVYLWRDKSDMDAFMASDLVKAVVSRAFVADVHSVDYVVPEAASRITRGYPAAG